MNFLAHAYLSFHHPEITVGNLIADFIKGNRWQEYHAGIQEGIRIHRAIDTFTDQHPSTIAGKKLFQPSCGKYSAVFIDIAYDHFLATDSNIFTTTSLYNFSQEVYNILQSRHDELPPLFQQVFSYMKKNNWLYNYRHMDGMYQTFTGMVRRAKYFEGTADVPFAVLKDNYEELSHLYRTFIPEIIAYIQQEFKL